MIQRLEQQVQQLQQTPAPQTQLVDALIELARAYSPTDLQKGIDSAQTAAQLAHALHYPQGEADSLIELSWLLIRDNRIDAASLETQHALYIATSLGDLQRQAKCTHLLAVIHHEAGNLMKAEALWLELLSHARSDGNRKREADYLTALGILRQEQSDLASAYDYKQRAHQIYLALADAHLVISFNNLAYLLTRMGRHDEALQMSAEALRRCAPEHKIWRSTILNTLGVIHFHLKNYTEARRLLNESVALGRLAHKQQAVRSLIDLAKLEWECNDRPTACNDLLQALALAEQVKSVKLQGQVHQSLYRYYLHMKAYGAASQHHEQYLTFDHEAGCKRMEKQVQIMRANATATSLRPKWAAESQSWLPAAPPPPAPPQKQATPAR